MRKEFLPFLFFIILVFCGRCAFGLDSVLPVIETEQVAGSGDMADDSAIWIHPTDPNLSLIIGQSKAKDVDGLPIGGIHVFDLNGVMLQFCQDGRMNNVDLRYNIELNGEYVDIVTAGNRSNDSIAVYKVDPAMRMLENIACRAITTGLDVYGSCMYRSAITGKLYAFVNDKDGRVEQWELFDNGSGDSNAIDGELVRSFDVGTQPEGCVADDEYGYFYIGEEDVGIWKYGAGPDDGAVRENVDYVIDEGGQYLTDDVEGLTIYYGRAGSGYLIASSQGSHRFIVYERQEGNDYVKTFNVVANTADGIDACTGTDGIEVVNVFLGDSFPNGLFITHDTSNAGGSCSNYKLVDWYDIATTGETVLDIDLSWDPRRIRGDFNGDSFVDIEDLQALSVSWLAEPNDNSWSTACDVSLPPDGQINLLDIAQFQQIWGF